MLTDLQAYRSVEAAINIFDALQEMQSGFTQLVSSSNDKTARGTGMTRREMVEACRKDVEKIYENPFEVSAINKYNQLISIGRHRCSCIFGIAGNSNSILYIRDISASIF